MNDTISQCISGSARYLVYAFVVCFSASCQKDEEVLYLEADRTIQITDEIFVDNGIKIRHPVFNLITIDSLLRHLCESDRFLIVPLKDFNKSESQDKVVLSIRHDVDNDINAAIRFAYREHKYGIVASYFILHTAKYYGSKQGSHFQRNEFLIHYLKKLQDSFGHEVGFHNDLVTLQVVYRIPPREYLKSELSYLRENNLRIYGTTNHGSQYCYIYKYYNAYFWYEYPDNGWNYEYVKKGYTTFKIEKDSLKNYDLFYEGGLLDADYFFADVIGKDGQRWNLKMVDLDTIQPGRKVIILLHPTFWEQL